MAKYLVTGGCGFIGSHLVEKLLFEGHDVVILDNLSTGKIENIDNSSDLIVGDVLDHQTVVDAFEGIDGCFHLAAIASVQKSNEDWIGTHQVNQTASINIFNAARLRKTPVVYASSAAVYGDNAEIPLKESSTLSPLTAYGADKLGSELHARVASLAHGVPTAGLRFFNVYGPRQDPKSPYSGVISIFVDAIMAGKNISIFGKGNQTRDFVYVKDVAKFLYQAMFMADTKAHVFNVCTGQSVSIIQLAKTIMLLTGNEVPVEHKKPRSGDIQTSLGDPQYAHKILDIRARYNIHHGLKELIHFIECEVVDSHSNVKVDSQFDGVRLVH